jgi:hypothetical protein
MVKKCVQSVNFNNDHVGWAYEGERNVEQYNQKHFTKSSETQHISRKQRVW